MQSLLICYNGTYNKITSFYNFCLTFLVCLFWLIPEIMAGDRLREPLVPKFCTEQAIHLAIYFYVYR